MVTCLHAVPNPSEDYNLEQIMDEREGSVLIVSTEVIKDKIPGVFALSNIQISSGRMYGLSTVHSNGGDGEGPAAPFDAPPWMP